MNERPLPPKIKRVLEIAAEDNGVTAADVLGRSRQKNTVAARAQAGTTLLRMGYTLGEVGRFLGLHHTSLIHMKHKEALAVKTRPQYDPNAPDLSGEWAI